MGVHAHVQAVSRRRVCGEASGAAHPPAPLIALIEVGNAVLAGISPFSIWYAVVLVVGLRSAAAVSVGIGAQLVLL